MSSTAGDLRLSRSLADERGPLREGRRMTAWRQAELRRIADADDLHVAPFRGNGVTYGTPTRIWSVAVDGAHVERAYNRRASR